MDPSPPGRVIGVAASAGGVEALRKLVSALPADLDAALCVVLHIPPTGRSLLAPILDRDTALTAVLAVHGMPLRPGMIYVAPADHHLLAREDRIELSRGPRENGVRPGADPLFRSIARHWGAKGTAVVLSGALDDGAAGAVVIARAGGTVLVQDPEEALVGSMPSATLAATTPDAVLPVDALAARLAAPAREPARSDAGPDSAEPTSRPDGPASGFTCPECNGALWERSEGGLMRYRCRVGHAYSEDAMVEGQRAAVEAALWTALEALEARSELLHRIAARNAGASSEEDAREAAARAAIIRRVLAADEETAA